MIEIYHRPSGHRLADRPTFETAMALIREQLAPDDALDLVVFSRDELGAIVQTLDGQQVLSAAWPALLESAPTNESGDRSPSGWVLEWPSSEAARPDVLLLTVGSPTASTVRISSRGLAALANAG